MNKNTLRVLFVIAGVLGVLFLTKYFRITDGVPYIVPEFTQNKIDAGQNSKSDSQNIIVDGLTITGRVENSLGQSLTGVLIEIGSIASDTVVSVTSVNGSYKIIVPFKDSLNITMQMKGMDRLTEQIFIDSETDTLVVNAKVSTKGSELLGVEKF